MVAKGYELSCSKRQTFTLFHFTLSKTASLSFCKVVWRHYWGKVGKFCHTLWLIQPKHCVSICCQNRSSVVEFNDKKIWCVFMPHSVYSESSFWCTCVQESDNGWWTVCYQSRVFRVHRHIWSRHGHLGWRESWTVIPRTYLQCWLIQQQSHPV